MKKIVTFLLISVGVFLGIVLPQRQLSDVQFESRSFNKLPSFDYWETLSNYKIQYCSDSKCTSLNELSFPYKRISNVNLGNYNEFYIYVNNHMYEKIQMYSQYLYNKGLKKVSVLTINPDNESDKTYIFCYPSTCVDNSSETLLNFEYNQLHNVYYAKVNLSNAKSNYLNLAYDPSWNFDEFKIQIQPSLEFNGFTNYIPYNQPYEINSGASIISVGFDVPSVVKGNNFNIIIKVDNPYKFKFDSVIINGDKYIVSTSDNSEIGNEYILKIPFTSTFDYGDLIYNVEKLVLVNKDNGIDYDIIDINETISIPTIKSFTDDIAITGSILENNTINLTDLNSLQINLKNPSKISIHGVSVNGKLYTNFTTGKNILSDSLTQGKIVFTRKEFIDGSIDDLITKANTLASGKLYLLYLDSTTSTTKLGIANTTSGTWRPLSSYSENNNLGIYTTSWLNISYYELQNNEFVFLNSSADAINNISKVFYSVGNINKFSGSNPNSLVINPSTFWIKPDDFVKIIPQMPNIEGVNTIKVDYIQFKKVIDGKTYYSNININNNLNVDVKNPINISNIIVNSISFDKSLAFSNEKVTGTINIVNPNKLNIKSIYINNKEIIGLTSNEEKNIFTFNMNLIDFYYMNLTDFVLNKINFIGSYNNVLIVNDLEVSNVSSSINLVDYNFIEGININSISLDKSYYLYGDNMLITLNLYNPNNINLKSIKILNNEYSAMFVSNNQYIISVPVPTINHGKQVLNINKLIFDKETLSKEVIYDYKIDYEVYTSSDIADVNILNYSSNFNKIYLYNNDNFLKIKYSNTTNLIPRSVFINNKEILNFTLNEENLIIIPLEAITDPYINTYSYELNSITFVNGNEISIKPLNNNILLNVVAPYQKQIEDIKSFEINGFNNLIFLIFISPLLNYVFPFFDNIALKHRLLFNIITYSTLTISCIFITYLVFRKELKNLNLFRKFRKR